MRENQATLTAAVMSAMNKQNVRARFKLRSQGNRASNPPIYQEQNAMQLDQIRSSNVCTYFKKMGVVIQIKCLYGQTTR